MWIDNSIIWNFGFLLFIGAIGITIQRIDKRSREMKIRMDRLSLTFMKIEIDLAAIQDCLLIMSKTDAEEKVGMVARIRGNRSKTLRLVLERGPNSSEILRGLEFPDANDDPAFWASDRMKRFGLEDAQEVNVEVKK
jgi:hypothetical protein